MTEEAQVQEEPLLEEVEVEVEASEESEAPQLSETEQKALEKGWRPKDQWEGHPDDYVGPGEYLARGELYEEISKRGKAIKNLEATITDMKGHMEKAKEVGYQQALRDLQSQQKVAVEEGDVDSVNQITEQIAELKANQAQDLVSEVNNVQTVEQEEVNQFIKRNQSWFNSDTAENAAMVAYAQAKEQEFMKSHPSMSPVDILEMVEKDVINTYSHRFPNEKKSAPATVEGTGNKAGKKSKFTFNDLSAEQKKIAQRFSRTIPGYSIEKYIKDLVDMGELK